jgi:hypothetical protein
LQLVVRAVRSLTDDQGRAHLELTSGNVCVRVPEMTTEPAGTRRL